MIRAACFDAILLHWCEHGRVCSGRRHGSKTRGGFRTEDEEEEEEDVDEQSILDLAPLVPEWYTPTDVLAVAARSRAAKARVVKPSDFAPLFR